MQMAYVGSNVAATARTAAGNNGITDTTNQVAVNQPPLYGSHSGAGYVEVIIRQPNPTIFMGTFSALFGSNTFNPVTVGARAVAGIVPTMSCVYALDPNPDDKAFDVQGSATITVPNCTIQINSSGGSALCTTGGADINAGAILIVGAQNTGGNCNHTQPNAQTGVDPVSDPFNNLTGPAPSDCQPGNTYSAPAGTVITQAIANSLTGTLQTGTNGSTSNVICFANTVSIASGVTLGTAVSGTDGGNSIFVFQNGLVQPGGSGNFTVNGTIDLLGGTFVQNNFAMTILAPKNGDYGAPPNYTYNALAFMVPSSNTTVSCSPPYGGTQPCVQMQFGSGSGNLSGMIYAPAATLFMQDDGGGNVVTALIAYKLYDKASNLEITNNYNVVNSASTPLTKVSMVE